MYMLRLSALFVFVWALLSPASVFAQDEEGETKTSECPEPDNENAKKLFKKYQDKKKYDYKERMKFLTECVQEESDYVQANFEYGRQLIIISKNHSQGYKPAEPYYKKVIEVCPLYHSDPYYYLGIIAWEERNYDDCIKYMQQYLDFKSDDPKKYDKDFPKFQVDAKILIRDSKVFKQLYGKPVPFDPRIVQGLSTNRSEYLPIITPDGMYAFYTRQQKPSVKSPVESDRFIEVFTESKKKADGTWDGGFNMPEPFNRGSNEGGATVTIDNKHLYFTICADEGGPQPNCDIWTSDLVNGQWTELKKLGDGNVNDPKRWDSQPTVSSDGKTIYFASDRAGGLGGTDIWKTTQIAPGKWSAPVNLGPKINTAGDEKSPFIHSDSQTLYFASGPDYDGNGGRPGVGGLDIFYSKGDDKGGWQEPVNIGYPINTKGDDIGFFVSLDGKTAYFASDDPTKTKNNTLGGYDIYSFELYKEARPEKVTFIEGTIDRKPDEPMTDVKVTLTNATTKKQVDAMVDTVTGKFRVIASNKNDDDLLIKVEKPGGAFSSQMVSVKDTLNPRPILKVSNLELKPIETGQTYTLNNIYYRSGSADLDPKSKIVIEEFVDFLKKNPGVKIQIWGHTDDVGNDADNLRLSSDRAFTVYELLISLGIDKSRVTAFKGFGETKPLVQNTSESNRAKNRRTEFYVVDK
jgi:outer membrane protein OmpA-like peptidoglycan-associated protein